MPRESGNVDHFSNWAYLIENDLVNNYLAVTRISRKTRASYYDPQTEQEIEDYEGGSAIRYNVMRTEYYYEGKTEIVEVTMYDVMLAHDAAYPLSYQYLKNAKDMYFIEAMPRTDLGYAVDTETPYGADRVFGYMTYDTSSNFEYLHLEQSFPCDYRSEPFGLDEQGASGQYIRQSGEENRNCDLFYEYHRSGNALHAEATFSGTSALFDKKLQQ